MLIDLSVNYFLYNLLHSLVYKMSENHWKKAQEYIFTMTVFFWATAENTKILSMQAHKHRKAANPHVWTAAAIRCVWHFGLKHKEIRLFVCIAHTCFSDQLCAHVCVCKCSPGLWWSLVSGSEPAPPPLLAPPDWCAPRHLWTLYEPSHTQRRTHLSVTGILGHAAVTCQFSLLHVR